MDVIFPEGGMGASGTVNIWDVVDHGSKRNIRISPFTDETMMRQKLDSCFGEHDWENSVIEFMIILIHADLEYGNSYQYNGPVTLLDLYVSAGGTEHTDSMQRKLLEFMRSKEGVDPLIKDLRKKFDSCRTTITVKPTGVETPLQQWARRRSTCSVTDVEKEGGCGVLETSLTVAATVTLIASKLRRISRYARLDDSMSYEEFYQGFLTPYHVHTSVNPMETNVVTDTLKFLDSDMNGKIEWGELLHRAYWVLENTDRDVRRRWNLKE